MVPIMRAFLHPQYRRVVAVMGAQMGKALALDTAIPTPSGWTTMRDVQVGDRVFSDTGEPTTVVGVSDVFTDRPCFEVCFCDGEVIVADAEHRWEVYPRTGGLKRVLTTAEILSRFTQGTKVSPARVAVAGPLEYSIADLPLDPYVLGVWLGDGNSCAAVVTSDVRDGVVEQLEKVLGPLEEVSLTGNVVQVHLGKRGALHERVCARGHEKRLYNGTYQCGTCTALRQKARRRGETLPRAPLLKGGIHNKLSELGLIGDKHIPAAYLRGSVDQRMALLQGLMDTDGYCSSKGVAQFYNTNKALADGFMELARGLGLKPRVREKASTYNRKATGSTLYIVTFVAYRDQPIFRLSRKQDRLRERSNPRVRPTETTRRSITSIVPVPSVPVKCIAVDAPSHLYLAGRACIPTHNTEAFWNLIGWRLDDDPTPILYVGPTQKLVESMSSDRVMKMLRSVPTLWDKLEKGKRNKIAEKFVGGVRLGFAWAGSATELAGHPAGLVLLDERDRMENSVGGEGDPGELAEARVATYPDGRVAFVSTPTAGTVDVERHETTGVEHWKLADSVESPIWRLWQEGTRHEWAVPCPDCGEYFVPRFRHLYWPKGATPHQSLREAALACINCGSLIQHAAMHGMNAAGRFVAPGQQVTKAGDVIGEAPATETASFWVSGLCSPWQTFGQRARSFLQATASGDPERIRSVINTRFGELFAERGDAPTWDKVMVLRSDYSLGDVPDGVLVLTAGVDVQKDRLIYVVRGWGHSMAAWLIDFGELWGETDQPDVWARLGEVLRAPYGDKTIRRTLVDSGFRPDAVYQFCRQYPGALPSKGHDFLSKPVNIVPIDITLRGKTIKRGAQLCHVWVDHFKSLVHGRIDWPADQPGAWHLPVDIPDDYARQLIAESRIVLPSGKVIWKRHDRENHALDCEVYAAAAARSLGVDRLRAPAVQAPAESRGQSVPIPQPVRRVRMVGRFA